MYHKFVNLCAKMLYLQATLPHKFMKRIFSAFIFLHFCVILLADSVKSDLRRLDAALEDVEQFQATKQMRINSYESLMGSELLRKSDRLEILNMLYEEYFTYNFDKALSSVDEMYSLVDASDKVARTDVLLLKANLLSTAGFYHDAYEILSVMDENELDERQLLVFYDVMQKYWKDYLDNSGLNLDWDEIRVRISGYRSLYLKLTPHESPEHQRMLSFVHEDEGRNAEAEALLLPLVAKLNPNDHQYAIDTYRLAVLCEKTGRSDESVHWYVESALCDIREFVKDNASLYSLAKVLINYGEVARAFKYTQFALDDALFYNAGLRPLQIAKTLPIIQNEYENQRNRQSRRAVLMISIISLLAAVLIVSLVVILRIMARRQEAERQLDSVAGDLEAAVAKLSEANAAKEEYLGLFLSMCSDYLDKLRKHVSMKEMDEELKIFYKTFDNAFLHLYPNFVSDFNALLREDEQVELKKDELLNTELRIFALIRLGISQSSHIASLLRYSVNTIYNYRAQVKKAAKGDPDAFEEQVKAL